MKRDGLMVKRDATTLKNSLDYQLTKGKGTNNGKVREDRWLTLSIHSGKGKTVAKNKEVENTRFFRF